MSSSSFPLLCACIVELVHCCTPSSDWFMKNYFHCYTVFILVLSLRLGSSRPCGRVTTANITSCKRVTWPWWLRPFRPLHKSLFRGTELSPSPATVPGLSVGTRHVGRVHYGRSGVLVAVGCRPMACRWRRETLVPRLALLVE